MNFSREENNRLRKALAKVSEERQQAELSLENEKYENQQLHKNINAVLDKLETSKDEILALNAKCAELENSLNEREKNVDDLVHQIKIKDEKFLEYKKIASKSKTQIERAVGQKKSLQNELEEVEETLGDKIYELNSMVAGYFL